MFINKTQNEVERQVLSCCIQDLNNVFTVSEKIGVNDFYQEKHRELFAILTKAGMELNKHNESDVLAYILANVKDSKIRVDEVLDIVQLLPSSANLPVFINRMVNFSRVRSYYIMLKNEIKSMDDGEDQFDNIIRNHEENYLPLLDGNGDERRFKDILAEAHERIIAVKNSDSKMRGFSWGLSKLDRLTSGIITKRTYVVGGLKKSGKSKFIINTIASCIKNEIKTGILSLEMEDVSLTTWLLSRFAHVDTDRVVSGYYSKDEGKRIEAVRAWLDDRDHLVHVDDRSGLDVTKVRSVIRRWSRLGVKVVFLDYLQRMDIPEGNNSRATAIQKATVQLADIAKQYDVALIYLSQLRNSAEGRKATIGDLKESGGIGESVDCSIIVNNMDRINKSKTPTNEAIFSIEQRDGRGDELKFWMRLKYSEYLDIVPGEFYVEDCDRLEVGKIPELKQEEVPF